VTKVLVLSLDKSGHLDTCKKILAQNSPEISSGHLEYIFIITNSMKFVSSHVNRHPIPDYYSITLEISRDRTTAAEELLCSSQDPSEEVSCSPSHSSSDLYLHRTLNDACQKMVSPPSFV